MKKLYLIGATCTAVLSFTSMSSQAITITDTVSVDGITWAQTSLFTNLSWDQMNAQCPAGVCGFGSSLNGWDLDGYSWASASQVGDFLFSAISPHTGGLSTYTETYSAWAPGMFSTIGFNYTAANGWGQSVSGLTSDFGHAGVYDEYGPYNNTDTINTAGVLTSSSATGAGWFYQTATAPSVVPVPAAVWLFGSGLLGLAGIARRKKA